MGLLISIRETWATFLRSDTRSGAAAYFGSAPAIPIFTEKLKSVEQAIIDAQTNTGISVVISTVIAKGCQNQIGGLYFKTITASARVLQNPKANASGVPASDCAEAIACFTRKFAPDGFLMKLEEIVLAPHTKAVAYDVVYTVEGGTRTAPSRPLLNTDGEALLNTDGTVVNL